MIVDLFAGIGGWELALEPLTSAPVVGYELDKHACNTRAAAGLLTIRGDVRTLVPNDHSVVEGLVGSPPCQTFSQAGKRNGLGEIQKVLEILDGTAQHSFADPRTELVLQPWVWAQALKPTWIALEQVKSVLPIWEGYERALQRLGYSTWSGVLNAADFGVPQTRQRAFLIASQKVELSAPPATHSKTAVLDEGSQLFEDLKEPWVTMAEALGWGATQRPSWTIPAHNNGGGPDGYGGSGARRAAHNERASGNWVEKPGWVFERPSTTIVGSFRPEVVAPPTYRKAGDGPRQNQPGAVVIEVEDALVLQSFPRDFPLQGGKTAKFLQVGNAVPPRLAHHVAARARGQNACWPEPS